MRPAGPGRDGSVHVIAWGRGVAIAAAVVDAVQSVGSQASVLVLRLGDVLSERVETVSDLAGAIVLVDEDAVAAIWPRRDLERAVRLLGVDCLVVCVGIRPEFVSRHAPSAGSVISVPGDIDAWRAAMVVAESYSQLVSRKADVQGRDSRVGSGGEGCRLGRGDSSWTVGGSEEADCVDPEASN